MTTLKTLSKTRIEYAKYGIVIGEAYRVDTKHDWFVGVRVNEDNMVSVHGKMQVIARIETTAPEVVQRKAVMAILKEVC